MSTERSQGPATAVAGLGKMGRAFALRLLNAGLPLVVANRTRRRAEEFAAVHGVPAIELGSVLTAAEVVVTSVADSAGLEALIASLLAGDVPARRTVIDMSTVSIDASARVAARLEHAGVRYLRAPVSGNPAVVESGRLSVMVSGDPGVLTEVRAVIEAIGPTVFHIGDAEQARAMKLALNVVIAGTTELLVEALALASAGEVSREQALEVITGSVVASPFLQYKAPALRDRDYSPTATAELIAKDMQLARELATGARLSLPVAELVGRLLEETVALGHAEKDFLALDLRLAHAAALAEAHT